jgi:ComF family protein
MGESIFSSVFTSLLTRARTGLMLPSSCLVCRHWSRSAVCRSCQNQFAQPRFRCLSCARPLASETTSRCGACLSLGSALDSCHAAVDYAYPWDGLIQRLKYADGFNLGAQPALAQALAEVMQEQAKRQPSFEQALQIAARSDWVMPVALHPERQKERGFNQALALAHALFPGHQRIRADMLLRIKNTVPQATLAHDARIHNLKQAFLVHPLHAPLLKAATVTLIDDVTTTTATLSAAAAALRQAGAQHIHALVFARVA